jgi:predicted ATPase/DNA-binding CsgD family transcriptional regulator/Tfp pilus assembly protein PilF
MLERTDPLPNPVTRLFGRDKDLTTLEAWMTRPDVRLVTITGLPGIGKTRLSVEVARALAAQFPDGVYFIPLNAITDPDLVAIAIAQGLGARESGNQTPLDHLIGHLRDQRALLVLDNFEQVISAAMTVAELLSETSGVKLLITSRTALHLSSEYEYSLAPLVLPELNHLPPLAELARLPSVAMFVARAQAVKPDFALTHANAPVVAQVCVRLDGIPLAIELAAARSKVLPPQALLTRLSHPFSVLTGGARDMPSRHQTLQRAIEWSYGLLNRRERSLFERMAVFNGGASIEAAEAVCDAEDEGLILDDLGILLDHSLLQSHETADGEPRFTMLEMIREFAMERLVAGGAREAFQQRHAEYYLRLAHAAEPDLSTARQLEWLVRLETDHDNFRAALQWALEHDPHLALDLAGALWYFWLLRSHYTEGRGWLERTLSPFDPAADGAEPELAALIAKAIHGLGTIAYYQSEYEPAKAWLTQGLAIRRRLGDRQGIAASLNNLGNLAHDQSDIDGAAALYSESRALREAIGDKSGVAASLSNLGNIALYRGDYEQAGELYAQSLTLRRQVGDKKNLAVALNNLGIVALHQGNYGRAALLYEESLAIDIELGDRNAEAALRNNLGELALFQGDYEKADAQLAASYQIRADLGERWGLSSVLNNMGASALHQGDYGRAVALLEESLVIKRDLGDRWSIANSLESLARAALHLNDMPRASALLRESLSLRVVLADKSGQAVSLAELGGLAAALGNFRWAARLMAAAQALNEAMGTTEGLAVGDAAEYERTRALIARNLSPEAATAAAKEGRALSAEAFLEHLDEILDPNGETAPPAPPAEAAPKEALTAREVEVLRLIANGLSYGQIAERLVISTRTVDAHLRSIYSKLQVRSRHEAARYAFEHHLVELTE